MSKFSKGGYISSEYSRNKNYDVDDKEGKYPLFLFIVALVTYPFSLIPVLGFLSIPWVVVLTPFVVIGALGTKRKWWRFWATCGVVVATFITPFVVLIKIGMYSS